MGGTMSVLVVTKGADEAFADDIAMSIASTLPSYLSVDQIDPKELEQEKAIQTEKANEDPSFAKKPANIQEKIIEGRVSKHFEELVLTFQEYILDSTKKVGDVLKANNCTPVSFVLYKVGEGIEKRQDDFAAEVAKEING